MNRPLKPCATCHHGKSKHRRHGCSFTQEVLAATFMGVRRVTKWCKCEGYLEATDRRIPDVSVDPPIIVCDGCGYRYTTTRGDDRRLCRECRIKAGWTVEW